MSLEHTIRTYLATNILYLDDTLQYDNDVSFISEGLIDSMGVMELVEFVSTRFHITVDQQDVTPDNFDSVNSVANYVRRKTGIQSRVA